MTVTAVVPCFNAERWIGRSLESVLGQTRPAEEIVVVDDGSTDSSCEIVQQYPVTLVRLEHNRGVSAARNLALETATQPLVAWLDADDHWDPHHLETLVPLLERHPEAAVAFSRARFAERARRPPWGLETVCPGPVSLHAESLERCVVPIMASLTRRDAVRSIGGFREELPAAVDFDLWLRLSAHHLFVWTPEVTATYHWRLWPTQISAREGRQLRCHWQARLSFWREIVANGEGTRATRVSWALRRLWAFDLSRCWLRRDVATLGDLLDLPDTEILEGVVSTRLRRLLGRSSAATDAERSESGFGAGPRPKRGSELITVALATHNRSTLLERTLTRIGELDVDGLDFEVVVIDNGSTDDTADVLKSASDVLPLRSFHETSLGSSHARNRGVREARGALVVWTDDDVLVDRDWLQAYSRADVRWPDASFFGGPIRPRFASTPPDWLVEGWPRLATAYATLDLGSAPLPLDRLHVPFGPNFAIRTDVARSYPFDTDLGVFGTSLRVSGEETNLFRQLLYEGHTGRWVPEAKVEHMIGEERLTIGWIRRFYLGIGRTMVLRHGPRLPTAWFEALEAEREYRRSRATAPPSEWVPKLLEASIAWGLCWRGHRSVPTEQDPSDPGTEYEQGR